MLKAFARIENNAPKEFDGFCECIGTTGQSLRLEMIMLTATVPLQYKVHV